MTTAGEQIRAGNLQEALADLQAQVKKKPAEPSLRIFLFQILAVLGDWKRALTQLEVAAQLDPTALAMRENYRDVLRCEVVRGEIFAGRGSPLVFGEPAEWIALLFRALQLYAEERFEDASRLRGRALEDAPATSGVIDDRPFTWIADADARLGPVLEAVVNGRYYWIPFMRLREMRIEKPVDLRDVAWTPVTLTFTNGGESVAMVPTRYPGSESSPDPRIVLARSTEWIERPHETYLGSGQRLWVTDLGEFPIMDVRVVKLGPQQSGSPGDFPG
jgi:type VI secretion system protein ImpE